MRRDERFVVGARAQLEIDVPSGQLQVVAAAAGEIRVTVESANADELEISQIGDSVSIREQSRWINRNRSPKVFVEVPSLTDLTIKTGSMNVSLRGALGDVRCRTASGDVDGDDVARLEVSTASGDVRIRSITGDAGFSAASGDVTVTNVAGRLTAQLASGDLAAGTVGSVLEVGTASGDVRVGRCEGSDINVKTVSGDIRIGLPAGIRVHPDISTLSGSVSLPTAGDIPSDPTLERREVRLRLCTVSGNVRVERV